MLISARLRIAKTICSYFNIISEGTNLNYICAIKSEDRYFVKMSMTNLF